MGIFQKLSDIQKELIAPKGQHNDFGKYNYRSCEDIVKALKPLCDKYKCVVYMTNDLVQVGDRIYIEATVTLADLESEASITTKAQAREEAEKTGMDGSQITGASSSYARKYALAGLFMIDNEKDSDATNKGDLPSVDTIGKSHIATIRAELERTGVTETAFLKTMKVKSIESMNIQQFTSAMNALKQYPDKNASAPFAEPNEGEGR